MTYFSRIMNNKRSAGRMDLTSFLPHDLFAHFFESYLVHDQASLLACRFVCKRWNRLSTRAWTVLLKLVNRSELGMDQRSLVEDVCFQGRKSQLHWLRTVLRYPPHNSWVRFAAFGGQLSLLQDLANECSCGQLQYPPHKPTCAWWAEDVEQPPADTEPFHSLTLANTTAAECAAAAGHLPVVLWLHEHGYSRVTYDTLRAAASQGHLEVVRHLYDSRLVRFSSEAARNAFVADMAALAHWPVMWWAVDKLFLDATLTDSLFAIIIRCAAWHGSDAVIRQAVDRMLASGFEFDEDWISTDDDSSGGNDGDDEEPDGDVATESMTLAIEGGKATVATIAFIRAEAFRRVLPWKPSVFYASALKVRRLDVLHWLEASGCPLRAERVRVPADVSQAPVTNAVREWCVRHHLIVEQQQQQQQAK